MLTYSDEKQEKVFTIMIKSTIDKDIFVILKERRLRITYPRIEILRVLKSTRNPVTVLEIHSKIRNKKIDLATVYRTINAFLEKQLVTDIDFKDEFKRYELTIDRDHHHHIVCKICGKIENIENCFTDKMVKEAEEKGYQEITHSLEFFGICEPCSNKKLH
ncbi:MAG: Ferric uptake regulation protein [Ignavibacteria bacterium]|nr:Ferric uptake regulation protein [Ignavibacteria bacterium]